MTNRRAVPTDHDVAIAPVSLDAQTDRIAAVLNKIVNQVNLLAASMASTLTAVTAIIERMDAAESAIESLQTAVTNHIGDTTTNPHAVTKTQIGLGSVENTALSTWAGTANITTIGTLSSLTVSGTGTFGTVVTDLIKTDSDVSGINFAAQGGAVWANINTTTGKFTTAGGMECGGSLVVGTDINAGSGKFVFSSGADAIYINYLRMSGNIATRGGQWLNIVHHTAGTNQIAFDTENGVIETVGSIDVGGNVLTDGYFQHN